MIQVPQPKTGMNDMSIVSPSRIQPTIAMVL
jgi:hypothetical protein